MNGASKEQTKRCDDRGRTQLIRPSSTPPTKCPRTGNLLGKSRNIITTHCKKLSL
jgi:hypothetical protein